MNCLYNHLVTSAKTPECNSSSKPLGEETEICCSTTKLSLPPLRHTFLLPEYKSLLAYRELKHFVHVRFSRTSNMFLISGNTRVVHATEMHVLLRRVLLGEECKVRLAAGSGGEAERILLLLSHSNLILIVSVTMPVI